jgi:poly(3-hydroxybutyrate) depolymerase
LFVAAMSGHHATLSRETFGEFLPEHEVYVTDWTDAKMVPLKEGRFGFEEYIAYVVDFLKAIGPGTHLVGLCQAGVPGLAAAAILSEENSDCRPASMTFMASPMDITVNPGLLAKLSGMISRNLVSSVAIFRVPVRYPGRGRLVYPGMVQLGNFMSLGIRAHIESHFQFAKDMYQGNFESAEKFRDFYDEYFSVLDSTAEFYIETLEKVFIDQTLPKGLLTFAGKKVDCASIKDVPIFTVEGMKDNMVNQGQCQAAATFCTNLPEDMKEYYGQEGVGHYGVFSGSKFRAGIAPKVKDFIARHDKK